MVAGTKRELGQERNCGSGAKRELGQERNCGSGDKERTRTRKELW